MAVVCRTLMLTVLFHYTLGMFTALHWREKWWNNNLGWIYWSPVFFNDSSAKIHHFHEAFLLFCKLCFYTALYSWVGSAGTQDCTSCMMVTVVQYCNIWTKQKHLLALLSYAWISTIVHATDNVCSCFQLEVVASDGSEMGARKPVICLFIISICMCVGNPTIQIHTPCTSGVSVCLRNYWRFDVFLYFKWLFSCSRTNVDRLLDSSQCCTYILVWLKFLMEDVLECLNMHAIKCHIWASRNVLPLLNIDWLFSAYDQSHTLAVLRVCHIITWNLDFRYAW